MDDRMARMLDVSYIISHHKLGIGVGVVGVRET